MMMMISIIVRHCAELYELCQLISTGVLRGRFHSNSHFTDEGIKACGTHNLSMSLSCEI